MHPAESGANDNRGLTNAPARWLGARPATADTATDVRRQLNNGFGESLARAFELAVTPAIFAWLGWLLDRRVGSSPLFMLVFFAVVSSYMVWKMFGRYEADMRAHEDRLFGRADSTTSETGRPPEPPT